MDTVMLIKIPFIQYLYGIKSMRQTVKEIEANVAYRWFLGLEIMDKVPTSPHLERTTPEDSNTQIFLNRIFSISCRSATKYE